MIRGASRSILPAAVLVVSASMPLLACSLLTDLGGLTSASASEESGREEDATKGGEDAGEIDGQLDATDASAETASDASILCRPLFTGPACETRCPDASAGPACEFRLVFGLDMPRSADWSSGEPVPYSENLATSVGPFGRVAYRLALDDQEIWVELDPFTDDARKLGVPIGWVFDQAVTGVTLRSFSPNRSHLLVPTEGKIEFWSNCYAQGADGRFDDDDEYQPEPDCYGSMQIHVAGEPAFSFNKWSDPSSDMDIGIGKSQGEHPDWTLARNAGTFARRRLEVYVR